MTVEVLISPFLTNDFVKSPSELDRLSLRPTCGYIY
jgi:hypothetical protein